MNTVYAGQFFRLTLNTGIVLTGATLKIKYIDPEGTAGEWTATISSTDATSMYVDFSAAHNNLLTVVGQYRVWGYATFSSGVIPGSVGTFNILSEGV